MTENKNCLGLLEKFRLQQEILKQNENIKSIYSYPNIELISNKPTQYFDLKKEEIFDKLYYYRDRIEQKDDEIFEFEQSKKEFFEFFEDQFKEIYMAKDLSESKTCIAELENLLFSNEKIKENFINKKMRLKDQIKFMNKIKRLMKFLEGELKFETQKENRTIENLQIFSTKIKNMAINLDDMSESEKENICDQNLPSKIKLSWHAHEIEGKNIHFQTNKKKKRTNKIREKLLSTAYIKKSKSIYGEYDLLFSPEAEDHENKSININSNLNFQTINPSDNQIKNRNSKLLLRNFLQIFLVKQNEIFSKYFYSKYDPSVLYEYRKFKFYEIKFCISLTEDYNDNSSHLKFLKSLFNKYLMIYNKTECNNFIKITICGVGKRQSVIQKSITKLINSQIKTNCLIKISMFSNILDCMKGNIKKIMDSAIKDSYIYHSNFNMHIFKKILKLSKRS